jgi:hypothetical protein
MLMAQGHIINPMNYWPAISNATGGYARNLISAQGISERKSANQSIDRCERFAVCVASDLRMP